MQSYDFIRSQVADRLEDNGVNVVGWDTEFEVNWNNYTYKWTAVGLLMRLRTTPVHARNKIVLLTHDFMHFTAEGNAGRMENLKQLKEFLRLSKKIGYVFRTIDTYQDDRPLGTSGGDRVSSAVTNLPCLIFLTYLLTFSV